MTQPDNGHDIRLRDIAVGVPSSESPAVVQHDYGKTEPLNFPSKGRRTNPRLVSLAQYPVYDLCTIWREPIL